MKILRGVKIITVAALSLFAVTVIPAQASSMQLTQMIQTIKGTPPAGSFDPTGGVGMAAEAIGRSRFADIYSGMALTDQGSHVNIYLTKLDPQTKSAIVSSAPSDNFTFILSPHTEKQMLDLHQTVIDKASTLQSNGINMVSWGPDVKTGKEIIEVENLTPSEEDYLNSQFGSENIELRNATSRPMLFDNRSRDSTPWNGGDFITHSGDCTSGFPASSGTTNYLFTASHCFSLGDGVYNGSSILNLGTFNTLGPIFRFSGSNLEATGIVTAGGSAIACSNYPSNRQCSSTLYCTDITSILREYGITLK